MSLFKKAFKGVKDIGSDAFKLTARSNPIAGTFIKKKPMRTRFGRTFGKVTDFSRAGINVAAAIAAAKGGSMAAKGGAAKGLSGASKFQTMGVKTPQMLTRKPAQLLSTKSPLLSGAVQTIPKSSNMGLFSNLNIKESLSGLTKGMDITKISSGLLGGLGGTSGGGAIAPVSGGVNFGDPTKTNQKLLLYLGGGVILILLFKDFIFKGATGRRRR